MHPSLELLNNLREGSFLEDLNEAATDAWTRSLEVGKPATVAVTLTFKPAAKGNRIMVAIVDDIKTRLPVAEKEETRLFRDASGRFTRRDPRQPELPMRAVARNEVDADGVIKEEASNG